MNDSNASKISSLGGYDSKKLFNTMSDPIKLAIILELIRSPDTSSFEIKKKLNLPGSRIYYYINQLVDDRIIEESETEKLTKHMSRRKFKITNWFTEVFCELDKAFHDEERENLKAFHLFQIHFAIAILTQQARLLEKVPENGFSEYINKLDLPYQQFFFADGETLPIIKSKHQETSAQIYQKHRKYKTMIDLIKNSTHITIFGTYTME